MSYIVGAYAAAPPAPEQRPAFFRGLAAFPAIRGLELSFLDGLATDNPQILKATNPSWEYVITAFPGTMLRWLDDSHFGLASPDPAGRKAGVDHARAIHQAACQLNDTLGRAAVLAVELHSAPTRTASADAFAESLAEVVSWDWQGAEVTVEHCDAPRPEHEPQKGYLELADELAVVAALRAAGHHVGITINWARSVIEGRDPAIAEQHISQARQAGLLSGLMFSGCAGVDTDFAPAWGDGHLPPSVTSDESGADHRDLDLLDSASLMTPQTIAAALGAAGDAPSYLGMKTSMRPREATVADRLANISQSLALLDRLS